MVRLLTHTRTHIKNTYTQTHNTYRSSLSAAQRDAATDLGYDAESWNNEKVRRFFFRREDLTARTKIIHTIREEAFIRQIEDIQYFWIC